MNKKELTINISLTLATIGLPCLVWLIFNPETFWQKYALLIPLILSILIPFGVFFVWSWARSKEGDDG